MRRAALRPGRGAPRRSVAAAAAAAGAARSGLHDARYCEIIELKGAPPARGHGLEHDRAQPLPGGAVERLRRRPRWRGSSATPLVVLNGPRHFLMDSVTAETGPRAHLPRDADARRSRRSRSARAADLVQTPYTDRTINARTTPGAGSAAARVFELVAPGGDVYVMQSYAQIVDPELTLGKLRRLGAPARRFPRAGATARGG